MEKNEPRGVSREFEIAKSEYENENARTASFDPKVNIMLPVFSTYLVAMLQMNNYAEIFGASVTSFAEHMGLLFVFATYTGSLLLASLAMLSMICVALPKRYQVVDAGMFYNKAFLENEKALMSFAIRKYITVTNANRQQNTRRMLFYRRACICFGISILLFVVYNVVKVFI